MILSTRDRLRSIQRSLENVIIPAIPEDADQAREQAQFAAMHCKAMLEQVNWEYAMEVAEAGHFVQLCSELATIAPAANHAGDNSELARLAKRCKTFEGGPPESFMAVREIVLSLRQLADRLLTRSLESNDPRAIDCATRIVLDACRRHDIRARAWVQESSYETGDVPSASIGESLDPARLDALLG